MQVGFNKGMAWLLIGLGGLNIVLSMMVGGRITTLVIGGCCTLVGFLFLIGRQLVVEANEILVKNGWGMTMRRYTFERVSDLRVEGKKLFTAEERVKGVGGMMADNADWQRLVEWIAEAQAEAELDDAADEDEAEL
jgi:hypothetical protein